MFAQTIDYWNAYAQAQFMSYLIWVITILVVIGINIACAIFINKDARKTKRMNTAGWTLVGLGLGIIGVLIYLLMKNGKT